MEYIFNALFELLYRFLLKFVPFRIIGISFVKIPSYDGINSTYNFECALRAFKSWVSFKKAGNKPNPVKPYHLSKIIVTNNLYLPTLEHRTCRSQTLIYMALHLVEFTWFHYSITCTFFLLHLSSPYDGRMLSATIALWCSDFPPCPKLNLRSFHSISRYFKKKPKQVRHTAIR